MGSVFSRLRPRIAPASLPRMPRLLPGSIRLESRLVVLPERGILVLLAQVAVAHREDLQVVAHEAAERIFGCTHDRFTAHIEARVHEHGTARLALESRQQPVE